MMVQDEHGIREEKKFIITETELDTIFPFVGGCGSFGGGSEDFSRRAQIVEDVKKREYHEYLCGGNGGNVSADHV